MASTIEEIVKKAKSCLRQGKNPVSAHVALGIASFEEGDAARAILHYQKAVCLSDSCAEAHSGLGISYAKLGQLDKALKHLLQAFKLSPECGLLANWLADAFFDNGDFDEAIRFYTEAIRLNASDSNAHNDMADVYRIKGDYAGAIELYDKTLSIDPHDTNAMLEKAQCLIQLERNDEAVICLLRLIKDYPASRDSATATVICGTLYFRTGNFSEAFTFLQKSLEFFPFNRTILFQSAVCAEKIHRCDESVALLKRILELDPSDQRASTMLKKVASRCC